MSESENEVIICGIVEGIELGSTRRRKDNKKLGSDRVFWLVFDEGEKIGQEKGRLYGPKDSVKESKKEK